MTRREVWNVPVGAGPVVFGFRSRIDKSYGEGGAPERRGSAAVDLGCPGSNDLQAESDLAKGIRVNQLAKELGVASKDILDKCRAEGLGDKVPNHMSVLSIGLSETVREWFSSVAGGGGGTAVQTAPPIETATRPKKSKVGSKKKSESDVEDEGDSATAVQSPS